MEAVRGKLYESIKNPDLVIMCTDSDELASTFSGTILKTFNPEIFPVGDNANGWKCENFQSHIGAVIIDNANSIQYSPPKCACGIHLNS